MPNKKCGINFNFGFLLDISIKAVIFIGGFATSAVRADVKCLPPKCKSKKAYFFTNLYKSNIS